MKKIWIPVLLLVSAAFSPYLWNMVELPQPCEVASAVASSLFWHLGDQLLVRELEHWTGDAPYHTEALEKRRGSLTAVFFQIFLKHAVKEFPSLNTKIIISSCRFPSIAFVV